MRNSSFNIKCGAVMKRSALWERLIFKFTERILLS